MSAQLTFPKKNKLKSSKLIDSIFSSGKSYYSFPVKTFYKLVDIPEKDIKLKAGFTVPKRLFKKAVTRNLLKRKMRESLRLHKSLLKPQYEESSKCLIIMFVYTSKQIEAYEHIDQSIHSAIQYLQKNHQKLIDR